MLSFSLALSSVTQMIAPLVETHWVHYSALSIVPAYSSFGMNLELDDGPGDYAQTLFKELLNISVQQKEQVME